MVFDQIIIAHLKAILQIFYAVKKEHHKKNQDTHTHDIYVFKRKEIIYFYV